MKNDDLRFRNIHAVVVKVTQRCNLQCSYCYEKVSKSGNDMSIEVFKDLVNRVFQNSINRSITFIFHGGEPTLLPKEWFEEAVLYANNKANEYEKNTAYVIQSNVSAISADKIDLFARLKIDIGVSIDGPPSINGGSMRGQETRTISNIKRIQSKGLNVGILTTINELNYDKFPLIMDWLYDEFNIRSFKANVAYSVGAGYGSADLSDAKVYQAQLDIIKHMVKNKGKAINEKNISLEIKRFFEQDDVTNKISLCDDRVCGAGKRVLGINLNGELLPCGRFEWNETSYKLGNLNDETSKYLKVKEIITKFQDVSPESWLDCNTCNAKKVCRYSCQAFIVRSKNKKNVECAPMKLKYQYFLENKFNLYSVYESISGNTKSLVRSFEFDY